MKLTVSHNSTYAFDPAPKGLVQSLRLRPADFEGQQVLNWSVTIEGAQFGAGFRDGAGDWVETATLRGPSAEVTVLVEGSVETADMTGVLRGHRERIPPLAYLSPTRATTPDRAISDLAKAAVSDTPESEALARAHALTNAVADALAYVPGQTGPSTTAAEALAQGAGVCQDQAHTLIAAALSIDMPARYVTGYFFATEGTVGSEASHAWAEIHIPDLGWVGFDATNRTCPDDRYIRLGSGADAQEAAPIRGVARGTAKERLDVSVAVTQVAQ